MYYRKYYEEEKTFSYTNVLGFELSIEIVTVLVNLDLFSHAVAFRLLEGQQTGYRLWLD